MRYLLDTGIAGHYINRRAGVFTQAREKVSQGHVLGICTPVLGELWHGVYNSDTSEPNRRGLRRALSDLRIWPYDNDAAEEFGRIYTELRRIGRPMQQIDIQVAAVAKSLGQCVVVTTDSDLSAVPGLDVENWAKI